MHIGPRSRRLALAGLSLSLSLQLGCAKNENAAPVEEPAVGVGSADPEPDPVPSGDADSPELAQIVSLDGPEEAKLGQIVTLRITTDFDAIETVYGMGYRWLAD